MTLGERIKTARKRKGITQKRLSELINKGFSTVQKYEIDVIKPSIDILQQIALALDIDILELLHDENELENIAKARPDEYKKFIDNAEKVPELFNQAVQDLERAYSESPEFIVDYYNVLNKKGKIEATKRTAELTKIEEYTKPDTK